MEIRRTAANLLIQAAPRSAAGPARVIGCSAAVGSAESERRRLWRAGGDGERAVAVEPSDTDEPAEAEVHEEEQHRETTAQGDDGDRRRESVAEEVEGERSTAKVQVLAGVSAQGEGAEPAGPRVPETAFAGGFGRDNGLYRCAGNAGIHHMLLSLSLSRDEFVDCWPYFGVSYWFNLHTLAWLASKSRNIVLNSRFVCL